MRGARNYLKKPKLKGSDITNIYSCPIKGCNRKYKRDAKLKDHIEVEHYYETRSLSGTSHIQVYNLTTELSLWKVAKNYFKILCDVVAHPNGTPQTDQAARNLLPQLQGNISDIDFVRIKQAQAIFAARMFDENTFAYIDWEKAIDSFRKFILLGLPYYDTNFNPTLPIDFIWHAAMQHPRLYSEYCGDTPIPHCAQERSEEDDTHRHAYFKEVYHHRYHEPPYNGEVNAVRELVSVDMFDEQIQRVELAIQTENTRIKTQHELGRNQYEKWIQQLAEQPRQQQRQRLGSSC